MADLPATEQYSPKQTIQIAAERTQQSHIDVPAVRQFLEGLTYPLYFLDFETIMPAVPMFDGCRPYAQVPFQFSLHIQHLPGGEVTHLDYLADGTGDLRSSFLHTLQSSFGPEGSIVSYNSSFETGRLKELAKQLPSYARWIESILPRFANADLLQPFRSFALYHPGQHGSASIKAVLPAFTDLSYQDLVIQEGGTASNQFLGVLTPKFKEACNGFDAEPYLGITVFLPSYNLADCHLLRLDALLKLNPPKKQLIQIGLNESYWNQYVRKESHSMRLKISDAGIIFQTRRSRDRFPLEGFRTQNISI